MGQVIYNSSFLNCLHGARQIVRGEDVSGLRFDASLFSQEELVNLTIELTDRH